MIEINENNDVARRKTGTCPTEILKNTKNNNFYNNNVQTFRTDDKIHNIG